MLQPLRYLWRTISQQISDEFTIMRQIIDYYRKDLSESMQTGQKMTAIKSIMSQAQTYNKWKTISQHYDKLGIVEQQINQVYSPYYDYQYLQELVRCLAEVRENGDTLKLMEIIRSHSDRNVANSNCPYLYRHAYNRSKKLIQDYQQELTKSFQDIIKADIPQSKKLEFFGEVRHAVGRSALLLSGGAIMGMYHIGVVQALIEADCLPKIITGSSAGSIIASMLATHTRNELLQESSFKFKAFIEQKQLTILEQFRRVGREGAALDIKVLQSFLRDNIGDYTFQQAYDKFGVILNITVTGSSQHDPDRLLNYLTSPNVLIWSASTASCAIPYIYGPTDLYCKDHRGNISKYTLMNRKFLDGSIGQDLPMNKLSILFNVNNFIVSQTNPWVVPFMDSTQDIKGAQNPILFPFIMLTHRIKEFTLSQIKHRASQIAYIFPNAVTKVLNLVTQSYVGDITIWPKPRFSDYLRILENPTSYQAILNFVHGGKQRTYPKVHHIKSTMFMQRQIDRCYRRIRNQSKLHLMKSLKESEDINQEELIMQNIFKEDRQWQQDQEDYTHRRDSMPAIRKKIKPLQIQGFWRGSSTKQDTTTPITNKAQKDGVKRNDSYALPRERSFM